MTDNSVVEKKNWRVYLPILGLAPLLVLIYAGVLLYLTWPVSELSISKSGVFGDSFGALTSLFSGLASAGMIVTLLMQREELGLQRKEMIASRLAQEQSARLSALSTLLQEYKKQIELNESAMARALVSPSSASERIEAETSELYKRKGELINEIEQILTSYHDRKS